MEVPYTLPPQACARQVPALFDPLDGSSNIDVNVAVGSIFSILRAATPGGTIRSRMTFLQPGTEQVGAGTRSTGVDDGWC